MRQQMAFSSPWPSAIVRTRLSFSGNCAFSVRFMTSKAPRSLVYSIQTAISVPGRSWAQCRALSVEKDVPEPSRQRCRLFDVRNVYIPYEEAWEWQHALVDELKADPTALDALLLIEHEPVFTLGTASKLENVLFDADELCRGDVRLASGSGRRNTPAALIRTERGGEVTYHGPGQLVVYPILNLHRHKLDLHWYLRSLEDVVLDMLHSHYGIVATRKEGLTGVFVGEDKICALGLKVSKWITMHGLALNVNVDLAPFRRIIPCGIDDRGVTSLATLLGEENVCIESVRKQFVQSFMKVFGPLSLQHEHMH